MLWLWAAALSGLACQPAGPPGGRAVPTTAPAPLPTKALLALAELTPPVSKPVNAPDAEKLPARAVEPVARAEEQLAKANYDKARELLERARGFAPKSPRVQRGLGLAFAGLDDRGRAEPYLRKSAAEAPDHVRVQLLLGQYAAMRGELDQAVLDFRTALLCRDAKDDNPDTAEVLFRLARALQKRGNWTASLECHQRLGRLISKHGVAYARRPLLRSLVAEPEQTMVAEGRLLMSLRKPGPAAAILERAYRRDKMHPQAGPLAVKALLEKGDFARAERIVMEMLGERTQRGQAFSLAGELCRAQRDPGAPARLLQAYLDRGGKAPSFVIAMAEVSAEMSGVDAAAKMLAEYLSRSPESGRVMICLARLYFRADDMMAGAKQLARILTTNTPQASQVYGEMRRLARQGAGTDLVAGLAGSADVAEDGMKPALLAAAGMLAEAVGDRPQAVTLLRRAIEEDATFWHAYEALDRIYALQGDSAAARELDGQVGKAGADSYFALYLAGKRQLARGNVEGAIGKLEQARHSKQDHVHTLLLLGRAYSLQEKHRNALQRLAGALRLAPDNVEVIRELFDFYMRRSRPDDAYRLLSGFLQNDPGSVPARVMLTQYYFLTNRIDRARKELAAVAAEAPDDPEINLLELRFELPQSLAGDPIPAEKAQAALKKLANILRHQPSNDHAASLRAALLVNQKSYLAAADALEPLHRRKPADARVAAAYLAALIEAKAEQRAAEAVERIARDEDIGPAMQGLLLDSLTKIKRHQRAAALVEKWLARPMEAQELSRLRFTAIRVYEAAEAYEKAQKLLDDWIGSDPGRAIKSLLRAQKLRMYALSGQHDQAIAYANKWLRNEPASNAPRDALLSVLTEAKAYDKAHAAADEWIRTGGDEKVLRRLKAAKLMMYGQEGKFDRLVRFGETWIAEDADYHEANRVLIAVLLEHEQYDQALKAAEAWLARQTKLAAPAAEKAEDLFDAQGAVVRVLLLAERKQQALTRARKFAQAAPDKVRPLRMLYLALSSAEKTDEALTLLAKIHKLDPDDAGVNNDLGYSWADRGINLQEAERMIRKALAARPSEIPFKDSLAWVLYKQGRFAEAKTVFDQIVSAPAAQMHPVILDHAGDTCWRLGLTEEALRLWQRAVELAKAEKRKDRETKSILAETPKKIAAGREQKKPNVAPLGEGVQ